MVGIPGEPFAELGLSIKEGWEPAQVLVVAYANGYFGYFPTMEAFQEGGYEAETSVFHPSAIQVLTTCLLYTSPWSACGLCCTRPWRMGIRRWWRPALIWRKLPIKWGGTSSTEDFCSLWIGMGERPGAKWGRWPDIPWLSLIHI